MIRLALAGVLLSIVFTVAGYWLSRGQGGWFRIRGAVPVGTSTSCPSRGNKFRSPFCLALEDAPVSLAWVPPGTSLGVFKDRPSVDMDPRRPLLLPLLPVSRRGTGLRPAVATGRSCSVFAVSHRTDGLLRLDSRGFVAPRCRLWGSPCSGFFHSTSRSQKSTFHDASPFEAFSSPAAIRSPDSYPLTLGHPRMVGFQGFSPLSSP
jgi:hypothetical protein